MRDGAHDLTILDANAAEPALGRSLLRDIGDARVRLRFHRLATGNTALTPYKFKYVFPPYPLAASNTPELDFEVSPDSSPPTNVHALIGRNGVGKSRCFDFLARCFLGIPGPEGRATGELKPLAVAWPQLGYGLAGFGHRILQPV